MNNSKTQKIATALCLTAFAAILVGTIAVPALLASVYSWLWLLAYPAYLIVTVAVLATFKKKK